MTTDVSVSQMRRLRNHFHFTHTPFTKQAWASNMYDSIGQKELYHALLLWLELKGIALVTGSAGVGKSITIRRFTQSLEEARYRVIDFSHAPGTINGFLRSLNRKLGLAPRVHTADLFDQVKRNLSQDGEGPHPIVIIDDAEGLSTGVLDTLRRLTNHSLDGEDRFSLLLSGTDELFQSLRDPALAPLVTRIAYAHQLRPFGVEDTRSYIRHHLERSGANPKMISEEATKRIFQLSHGKPRTINQIAQHAMIAATVAGKDIIDGDFLGTVLAAHPLFPQVGTSERKSS